MSNNMAWRSGRVDREPDPQPATDWRGQLEELAGRLVHLAADPRQPMRFHEEK